MQHDVTLKAVRGALPAGARRIEPAQASGTPDIQARHKTRLQLYLSLVILDLLCIVGSFMAAAVLRFGDPLALPGLNMLPLLLPVFLITSFNLGAYSLEVLEKPRVGSFRATLALASAVSLFLLAAFFLKASTEYSRFILLFGTGLSVASLLTVRFVFGKATLHALDSKLTTEVVITDGVFFAARRDSVLIDAARAGLSPDTQDPMMLDRLGSLAAKADRVIVACPPERRALWALLLKGANVRGEVLAPECEEVGALGVSSFGKSATMTVSCGPLDLRSRALKRALDLAITVPVLVFLAPLMLAVALAIKLESEGPVFFRQRRLGRGNRLFMVLKFRSMRTDLCDADGKLSASRDDARITRVGRFIRATSLDELPQLLNVLRGEMSLVGPRPHALGSLAGSKLFWEVDERYWHRHACKPGITGLAQVRGFRGATHHSDDLVNRLQADLEYLVGWTIFRDIAVLVRTFRVLVHQNAY